MTFPLVNLARHHYPISEQMLNAGIQVYTYPRDFGGVEERVRAIYDAMEAMREMEAEGADPIDRSLSQTISDMSQKVVEDA